jgi:hypothetical protein
MRGHVTQRGKGGVWYAVLNVRVNGKRKTVWRSLPDAKGKREAEAECRKLVAQIDTGDFAMPERVTLAQWVEHWIAIGCVGRKRKAVSAKSAERYSELLRA